MAKILLVEDDNNLRDIYGERLMAEGYEIISASDGEEALQLASQQKPDLIISDVMMPKISGFDMLDILRQTPDTKDIKIIMMTALSQAEDKSRADKLGADKYLVKSQVTLEDVARVVHDILGDAPEEETDETDQNASFASSTSTNQALQSASNATSTNPAVSVPAPEPAVATNNVTEPVVGSSPTPDPAIVANPSVASTSLPANPVNTATISNDPAQPVLSTPTAPDPTVSNAPAQPVLSSPTGDNSASVTTNAPISTTPTPVGPVLPVSTDPISVSSATATNDTPTSTNIDANPNNKPILPPSNTPAIVNNDASVQNNISSLPTAVIPDTSPITPTATAPTNTTISNNSLETANNFNLVNNASIANPISGTVGVGETTAQNQAEVTSDATTTEQEISEVAKQIESFMASNSPEANHTAPLKEPTEQDLIHAQNANEDPKVVTASTAPNTQATTTLDPTEQMAPPVAPNPSIPPIIKPQIDTANPEPVSNRKRIIQPINDTTLPDIHKLYEQQLAAEAAAVSEPVIAQTPTATPVPSSPVPSQSIQPVSEVPSFKEEQVFNPITTNTDPPAEVEPPALEQVDITAIAGANEPTGDTSFSIPAPLPTNLSAQEPTLTNQENSPLNTIGQQEPTPPNKATNNMPTMPIDTANQSIAPQTTPEPETNPNDPSNFAL
jgi:CheY-like chemotaxis protein